MEHFRQTKDVNGMRRAEEKRLTCKTEALPAECREILGGKGKFTLVILV